MAVQRYLEESLNKEITNEGYVNTMMDICLKGLIENNHKRRNRGAWGQIPPHKNIVGVLPPHFTK